MIFWRQTIISPLRSLNRQRSKPIHSSPHLIGHRTMPLMDNNTFKPTMRKWAVIWTYIANFGELVIEAATAERAAEIVCMGFSDDFRKRGTIYVVPFEQVKKFRAGKQLA